MKDTFDFEDLFDKESISKIIAKDQSVLKFLIHDKVKRALLALEPAKCLSFDLFYNGTFQRRIDMEASLEYAKILIAFMREQTFNGYTIESQITPVIIKTVEDAIVEFYSSEKNQNAISLEITRQLKESKIINAALNGNLKENEQWLKNEVGMMIAGNTGHSFAGQAIDTLVAAIGNFFSSSIGKTVLLSIGKIMATQTGQVLIRYTATAVSKALASAAFKTAVLTTIKKVGVGILIKTAVGKALLALLALVGISGIPIAWVILPIIAGILIYEYNHFPEKLANKLPDTIADGIDQNFKSLNYNIIDNIIKNVSNEFIEEITKVKN